MTYWDYRELHPHKNMVYLKKYGNACKENATYTLFSARSTAFNHWTVVRMQNVTYSDLFLKIVTVYLKL